MNLRERLRALFSPTRKLLTADTPVVSAGGALGAVEWVVPRSRCQYHRAEFAGLPPRRRQAAAMLAARQHEAAPGARSQVAWSGAVAHIWVWNGVGAPDAQDSDVAVAAEVDVDVGLPALALTWTPESLLRRPPVVDEVRLLRLVEGYEGQHWQSGVLRASRWWGEPPTADAWGRFLRGCGLPVEARVPSAEDTGWADQPWAKRGWRLPASPARVERLAWQGVLGLLVLLVGWQLAAAVTWTIARERLDDRLTGLRAQATPLLDARERAEAARGTLEGYRRLSVEGLSDYALMAEVATGLPADGQMSAWQRDRERLQVQVRSTDTDPRRFVSAYQDSAALRDATAAPGREGAMQLDFIVAIAGPGTGDTP